MANCYNEGTGFIVLKEVTPVIYALFSQYMLDAGEPTDGKLEIGFRSDEIDSSWESIFELLAEAYEEMGLATPGLNMSHEEQAKALVRHFTGSDEDIIAEMSSDTIDPTLQELHRLAMKMDDGHGLEVIQLDEAWYTNKLIAEGFGGRGTFLGKNYQVSSCTYESIQTAQTLDQVIGTGDLYQTTEAFFHQVKQLLGGIVDESKRPGVQQVLAEYLAADKVA